MDVVSLTPQFVRFLKGEISEAEYIALNPSFFKHYFTYWAHQGSFESKYSSLEYSVRDERVRKHIILATEKLSSIGLSLSAISSLIFVGSEAANGHAFKFDDRFIAWFALETFSSEEEATVFVMHELIHTLHYHASPDFYFETPADRRLIWRQLITEGIATYLTFDALGVTESEALWADFLPKPQLEDWMASCKQQEKDLFQYILDNYDSCDASIAIFYAANPKDIWAFRAGYYVGLQVIKKIIKNSQMTAAQLLSVPANRLRQQVKDVLLELL
jgi:uncharacterized protein YjaZ